MESHLPGDKHEKETRKRNQPRTIWHKQRKRIEFQPSDSLDDKDWTVCIRSGWVRKFDPKADRSGIRVSPRTAHSIAQEMEQAQP